MKVTIFILCYNESKIIRQTIQHYKYMIPSATIVIYDNESTDNSVEIAHSLGCQVNKWNTGGKLNEFHLSALKNSGWRTVQEGWVIICDMDEWLCVTQADLLREYEKGTTVLKVKGYNMIGDSRVDDLSDINLFELQHGVFYPMESKNICFLKDKIESMNYSHGSHSCNPRGIVKYSDREYILKHMDVLGLQYKLWKNKIRYDRSEEMRQKGFGVHYTNDLKKLVDEFNKYFLSRVNLKYLLDDYVVDTSKLK